MKNVMNKQYYWDEDYLYFIYKLLNISRFAGKDLINFEYLRPPHQTAGSCWMYLNKLADELNIEIKGWVFHKELYKQFYPNEYKKVEKQLEFGNKNIKIIWNNSICWKNFKDIPIMHVSVWEFVEFSAKLPQETINQLEKYLNAYIQLYIEGELLIEKNNVPLFSNQKFHIDSLFKDLNNKYGRRCIVTSSDGTFLVIDDILFLHNIVAYEYLRLLEVEDMVILDYDKDPMKQTEKYIAKMVILPKLLQQDKKVKKKDKESSSLLKFDNKRGLLFLKGKEINFSKKPNQKELLNTLFKDRNKKWYYDEIVEDWDDKADILEIQAIKNWWVKFRTASDEINKVVELTIGMNNFLNMGSTPKGGVQINQRYLDES
jgi:hypothetical protein